MSETRPQPVGIEWVTLGLILACYMLWGLSLFVLPLLFAIPVTAFLIALHSSLTHEVLHGHPFQSKNANEALMLLPLNLCIPYHRFRDLHLAHHRDANLTDPYDDPESNYLDPQVWQRMSWGMRLAFSVNNTLMGRILLGPLIGQLRFMQDEYRGAVRGDRAIWRAWGVHVPGVVVVLTFVVISPMPVRGYLLAAYLGLGLLKIRTFLEHRAHAQVRCRTVIVEDRGILAFLFLNNNLHVVHHMNPAVPWYQLPGLYRAAKERYQSVNDGYVYSSYAEVFRRYFWQSKDPVAHPLWSRR